MLLNSFNNSMEQTDNSLPLLFVWDTHYKPQAKKFYEMPKIILFLKAELHNLSLGIDVKSTKLDFIKAEIFLISPCNNSMTLCLSQTQCLQLKISAIILEVMNCKWEKFKKNAVTTREYWKTICDTRIQPSVVCY